MYYAHQSFQTIFDRLQSDENKRIIQVRKEFYILVSIRTVSSACAEIKPSCYIATSFALNGPKQEIFFYDLM